MIHRVAFNFAVLLSICEIGSSLKCIQCRSEAQPECNGNLTSSLSQYVVDCDDEKAYDYNRLHLIQIMNPVLSSETGNIPLCLEMIQNGGSTARTCFRGHNLTLANQLCNKALGPQNWALKSCRYCDHDFCNGSTILTASHLTLIFLVAMYFIHK